MTQAQSRAGYARRVPINKWGYGICDTLALGILVEAIGEKLPVAALPFTNYAHAAHPAFEENIAKLRSWGVRVRYGPDVYPLHAPGRTRCFHGVPQPDCPARQQTADAFLGCLGVGPIRWHEIEAFGCCRGAQRAVKGREFRAAFIDPAHSQSSGQLNCVISPKAMRCAQPGRLIEEAPSDCDGGETRGLRVGPEVISLEIGGKQSRVACGQLTHALLPPQCRRNLHPGELRDSNTHQAADLLVASLIRVKFHQRRGIGERAQRSSLTSCDSAVPAPARLRAPAASSRGGRLRRSPGSASKPLVQAFPQALGLGVGQMRVRCGIEYGGHVVIHATALPPGSMADPFDEVG